MNTNEHPEKRRYNYPEYDPGNDMNFKWQLLAFFVPLIGLIMSLMSLRTSPSKAFEYVELALFGFGFGVACIYIAIKLQVRYNIYV